MSATVTLDPSVDVEEIRRATVGHGFDPDAETDADLYDLYQDSDGNHVLTLFDASQSQLDAAVASHDPVEAARDRKKDQLRGDARAEWREDIDSTRSKADIRTRLATLFGNVDAATTVSEIRSINW